MDPLLTCVRVDGLNAEAKAEAGVKSQGNIILRYVSVAQVWSEATTLRYATTYNAYYV